MNKENRGNRIIFTGPTGTDKKIVFEELIKEYCSLHNIPLKDKDRYFRLLSIEHEIKDIMHAHHIMVFLNEKNHQLQAKTWEQAFKILQEKAQSVPSNVHLFIEFHSCYFLGQRRLSFWTFPQINSLNPTCFVTLLDDSYTIWYKVGKYEDKELVGSYLRLQDIIEWRRTEVLLTDLLANSIKVRNFIIPVKHPRQTLYRLLFDSDRNPCVYISYPITNPRKKGGKQEIDEHRYTMHGLPCVAFDPLTIDERVLQFSFARQFGEKSLKDPPKLVGKEVSLQREDRWTLSSPDFPPMVADPVDIFPLNLPAEEVYGVVSCPPTRYGEEDSLVNSQIKERDFRYICDAKLLVAYRPFWKKFKSEGVLKEIEFSRGIVPIIVYHPKEDSLSRSLSTPHPLAEELKYTTLFPEKEDFYKKLRVHLERLTLELL